MKPNHEFDPAIAAGDQVIDDLAQTASGLGFEIVEIDGLLADIEQHAQVQKSAVGALSEGSDQVTQANAAVIDAVDAVSSSTRAAKEAVDASLQGIKNSGKVTHELAEWVSTLDDRVKTVEDTLAAVRSSNNQISAIAKQVNILAINAKIEAARAGDAGRGFAVVAEAINELSHKTAKAADGIFGNVGSLAEWVNGLRQESDGACQQAETVMTTATEADRHMAEISTNIERTFTETERMNANARHVQGAIEAVTPSIKTIVTAATETTAGIEQAHLRISALVDRSERIVQATVAAGGTSLDEKFISHCMKDAGEISRLFEEAVATGKISEDDLFSQDLKPIANTNPQQVMAPFTKLTDELFPPILEAALDLDPRVVFCAAVNVQGYLPTHNKKFGKPQTEDAVWNTANSRNRRVFDDRVGLKAGRNAEPFLMQVYRRDMGGGEFLMMKDLACPIFVNGRHWGGLRLAYKPA